MLGHGCGLGRQLAQVALVLDLADPDTVSRVGVVLPIRGAEHKCGCTVNPPLDAPVIGGR